MRGLDFVHTLPMRKFDKVSVRLSFSTKQNIAVKLPK